MVSPRKATSWPRSTEAARKLLCSPVLPYGRGAYASIGDVLRSDRGGISRCTECSRNTAAISFRARRSRTLDRSAERFAGAGAVADGTCLSPVRHLVCCCCSDAAHSHIAVRSLGVTFGIVLLAIGVTASLGLPVLTLPAPDGPHVVGSTSLSLIDETRDNSFFDAPDEKRELYVQIWYPGAIAADQPAPRVRTLWQELYRGDRDRFTMFSSYLRGTKTHSHEDIPLSPAQARLPRHHLQSRDGVFPRAEHIC